MWPMRVMFVPKSIQVVDSLEFAQGLHASRLRQLDLTQGEPAGLLVPLSASPYLVAYMAWPNDEAKRHESNHDSIFSAVWLSPDAVIGIADGFEYFGLNTKPHGAVDTFLPSTTTWRLPEHCCKAKPFLVPRSLSQEQRKFLQSRKSRKPYAAKPTSEPPSF